MKIYITMIFSFSAGHRLYDPNFSDEDNYKIYGKCSNPTGHGHNYKLAVTIYGEVHPIKGVIINYEDLRNIVYDNLLKYIDHKNLNTDVKFLEGINPTAENLCLKFWDILSKVLPDGMLNAIKLYESDKQGVSCKG